METLAEQPYKTEQQKSFDPLASVRMLRYDLDHFGQVLPETRGRVCDEELSYLVEGVDKAALTRFVIRREDEDLVYFDRGKWKPYLSTLVTGLETAKQEAADDPRRQFLADNAVDDLQHGYDLLRLQPGEQKAWHSAYAHKEEVLYGKEFIEDCGMIPHREMAFLYLATCLEDGNILLESQTVDRSDDDAFAAVYEARADNPQLDMDGMVAVYDGVLHDKHGGHFFAGRRESEKHENAWDEIHKHRELIEFHLNRLEEIATTDLPLHLLERIAKQHLIGVWASFKKRLDGNTVSYSSDNFVYVSHQQDAFLHQLLYAEVQSNFKDFASRGEVLVGCGGAIRVQSGETDIMGADASDVFSSIFSDASDRFGSLTFTCPNGHSNRRPYGKLLSNCKTKGCKADVRC